MKKSNLQVKVLAMNTHNEHAAKFVEYEKNHFQQFLGKDIFKVGGEVKAKYSHEKLAFKGQLSDGTYYDAYYWFTASYGYFDIHVKICINGGSWDVQPATAFCQYEELSSTLFTIKDGILCENTREAQDFTVKYNEDEIRQAAEKVKQAAVDYNSVVESVPYLFRDIFYIKRV